MFDFLCQPHIEYGPNGRINNQQHIDVHVFRYIEVKGYHQHREADNANHSNTLGHADSEEFVVDVVFVGQEGVLTIAYTMEVDADDIETGNDNR